MDENINIKAYEQGCNSIRHYSILSSNVRTLTIIQGIVLLVAWITTYKDDKVVLQIAIPGFGLLFTILLALFNYGYYSAAEYFFKSIEKMEEQLFDKSFRVMHGYHLIRVKSYKNIFKRLFVIYAPFTLLTILFFVALIISLNKNKFG